ncbi:MAG TPA: DUF3379 family protein [Dokdonella sp.]|uniref:DUF3379 family protein n=1 Tax=Dokdonella sp. TaxID=2291710 RepID=UPI002D7EDB1F|nr:DUF3379 family protein [Dokdonella sp.]HET9031558.1 DUF3379 family protein [Dokdonella sp.]
MNCLEFRRRLGSEPASTLAAFVAHREECARCASAQIAADEFEKCIRGSLSIPVPANLADRIILAQTTEFRQQRRNSKRGMGAIVVAVAASILIAVVALSNRQTEMPALAGMVVEHLQKHVVSATDARNPIPKQDVMAAFADRGVRLNSVPDGVNYVHECPAGPYKSVHMVMPERGGPVNVVYVVDKPSQRSIDFSHDGMRGREVPIGKGSLVMLASSDGDFDAIEHSWKQAMVQGSTSYLENARAYRVGVDHALSPLVRNTFPAAP